MDHLSRTWQGMSIYNGVRITQNPTIFNGRPVINGHRITVHDIVVHYRAGTSPEELGEAYSLTADEIVAALAYYQEHKATIDRQIAADQREFARRAAADNSSIARQMRRAGKDLKRPKAT